MTAAPAFGLYPSRDFAAVQRLAPGHSVALDTPVDADGALLFRTSCWLPVPAIVARARGLRLAGALQLRFTPVRFEVPTSNRAWFSAVRPVDPQTLRIDFVWPASVARVSARRSRDRHAIELHRADGDAVADKATQGGSTGTDLEPPWIGSPLVVVVGDALPGLDVVEKVGGSGKVRVAASPVPAVAVKEERILASTRRAAIGALVLSGRPAGPRMTLYAERDDAAGVLLWQALLPGEHDEATLPERPVAEEWAGALAQLASLAADPDRAPARLRLDIESDAPCRVSFTALALALNAQLELLAAPQRLDFRGDREQELTLDLTLPAGVTPGILRLSGRVVGDAQAGVGAAGARPDARQGALLLADRSAWQPLDLARPASLAGLAIDWQPLSSRLLLRLRLLGDSDGRPGARVLVEQTRTFETGGAGWLALRWAAFDLQPQRVWVEVTVLDGSGLWLFGADGAAAGWTDSHAATTQRDPLPRALRLVTLDAVPADLADRALAVNLDGHGLASALQAAALEVEVPAPLVALLADHRITFAGSIRASVTIESARLEVAVA